MVKVKTSIDLNKAFYVIDTSRGGNSLSGGFFCWVGRERGWGGGAAVSGGVASLEMRELW